MMAVFQPFQLACQSRNSELVSIAIDCLGKLFTYDFWGQYDLAELKNQLEAAPRPQIKDLHVEEDNDVAEEDQETLTGTAQMIAFVIDAICGSYTNTDEKVELQIVKALQAAVSTSSPAHCLHGSVLLSAIRTTYNIFLVSNSVSVQTVAQGALTQMVQTIFGRVPKGLQITLQREIEAAKLNGVRKAGSFESLRTTGSTAEQADNQFIISDEASQGQRKARYLAN